MDAIAEYRQSLESVGEGLAASPGDAELLEVGVEEGGVVGLMPEHRLRDAVPQFRCTDVAAVEGSVLATHLNSNPESVCRHMSCLLPAAEGTAGGGAPGRRGSAGWPATRGSRAAAAAAGRRPKCRSSSGAGSSASSTSGTAAGHGAAAAGRAGQQQRTHPPPQQVRLRRARLCGACAAVPFAGSLPAALGGRQRRRRASSSSGGSSSRDRSGGGARGCCR